MTPLLLAALALLATNLRWQVALGVAVTAAVVVAIPAVALPLAAGCGLVAASRRWLRKRRAADQLVADVASMCDLVAIALTGGLGLRASLVLASAGVGGEVENEVAGILRRALVDGMSVAMGTASGAGRRLYRVLARSSATGSEIAEPVRRLADEMNAEQAAARLEAVRRIPVLMLFPLTVLILPGFLLLAIAPALLNAVARLEL